MHLFVENQIQTGLKVCRIKNKFLSCNVEPEDGYRDVTLNVLLEAENGLKIIGEIQVSPYSLQIASKAYCEEGGPTRKLPSRG